MRRQSVILAAGFQTQKKVDTTLAFDGNQFWHQQQFTEQKNIPKETKNISYFLHNLEKFENCLEHLWMRMQDDTNQPQIEE